MSQMATTAKKRLPSYFSLLNNILVQREKTKKEQKLKDNNKKNIQKILQKTFIVYSAWKKKSFFKT
jgi:hypothetical protein